MSELEFAWDIRDTNSNKNGHRKTRFKKAFQEAVAGRAYQASALQELTWGNLGWRLGKLFGESEEELIDELYDWCVRQQKGQRTEGA